MDDTAPGSGSADPDSTSSSLLKRVQTRDTDAWRRFSDLYGPRIYRWCRQLGLQAADAADVAQEVFGAVLAGIENFHRDRVGDSLRGWLWTITRNKVRDHLRRRHGEAQAWGGTDFQHHLSRIPEEPSAHSAADPEPDCEAASLERRALASIQAGVELRTWEAFWGFVVEGRAAAEVARDLGMSVPAVYKAKYRVIREIRRQFDDRIGQQLPPAP
jgi:RNA polymerase sigma-70 factor, ECF subfamily